MRRLTLAVGLLLAGCANTGRFPGATDIQCMHTMMAHGDVNGVPLSFDAAYSRCERWSNIHDPNIYNSKMIPLDFRADPNLQAMAENSQINTEHWPFVPRDSTAPIQKWPIFTGQP
ncbi:hypothetical protein [Acetobacter sp. DsW_063]|uniref:hypothetical protein n=1 Tax=Acetobacter sp. DsW_063 TaxID=1514894 RepID=UPI000A380BB9|nr:hypothetical protein [Acetobacter sp. DsW_063]